MGEPLAVDDPQLPDESTPENPPPQEHHSLVVDAGGAGERLDRWLAARLPELSRSRISQLIDDGDVTVDGGASRPAARLRPGSTVELRIPPPVPALPQAEDIPLPVLYEDADLVVVDKPAGMVVHPAAGVHSGTMVNALLHHVTDLAGIGGELRPGIVHRLDKDTSGVLVVAKNDFTLAALQRSFQARDVDKRYLAIVHGVPAPTGTIDTPFGRHPVDRTRMTGKVKDPDARRAVTHFTLKEMFGTDAARVEVQLETGRTHQIRVHFSELGHPLLCDETYGGAKRDKRAAPMVRQAATALGRQALHAARLAFAHPRDGRPMSFEAPLPEDLRRALEILRTASVDR